MNKLELSCFLAFLLLWTPNMAKGEIVKREVLDVASSVKEIQSWGKDSGFGCDLKQFDVGDKKILVLLKFYGSGACWTDIYIYTLGSGNTWYLVLMRCKSPCVKFEFDKAKNQLRFSDEPSWQWVVDSAELELPDWFKWSKKWDGKVPPKE